MPWWDDDFDRYFPPSRPRKAKGGIKARSARGEFGENWWARRWIKSLEGFGIGSRLERGRRYARGGQVLSIAVEKGLVRARVQGSRPKPYEVAIHAKTLPASDWEKVTNALSARALFAAKLLAGEMPPEIERVFDESGVSLFPSRLGDLATKCSCPDMANPCKHIAAVYYLIGEEFDRDPFLIFTLRGRTRDELLAALGRSDDDLILSGVPVATAPPAPPEPLAADPAPFWSAPSAFDPDPAPVEPPPVPAALPRRLGGFPFWRGAEPLQDALEPLYAAASARALDLLLRDASDPRDSRTT
jgi:uncharacterized Zn finger protein